MAVIGAYATGALTQFSRGFTCGDRATPSNSETGILECDRLA